MILTLIIAVFSLLFLVVTHELGHFLVAKAFGIRVEEFGIGYPPKIWGKKIGETVYSLNLIPFGAFVRIFGHEERISDPRSFSTKPIWQRMLVVLGGVITFWIVAYVIFCIVMIMGAPTIVEDNDAKGLVDIKVQLLSISKDSPAEKAGLQVGDTVTGFTNENGESYTVETVGKLQDLIKENKGNEVSLGIKRGGEILNVKTALKENNDNGQGILGVGLVRTALKSYPWYEAPIRGAEATWNLTVMVVDGWVTTFSSLFKGQGVPQGVEVRGVVGIFDLFLQAGGMGAIYFLQFVAIIAVSLALVNVLPIPALDGGWFILLVLEMIRKKPISEKIEKNVSSFFFLLLISLMLFVTIKDIIRLF